MKKEHKIWRVAEIEMEIRLWNDLKKYISKNMKGKTLTKDLEKEVNYMLKERKTHLKNLNKLLSKLKKYSG